MSVHPKFNQTRVFALGLLLALLLATSAVPWFQEPPRAAAGVQVSIEQFGRYIDEWSEPEGYFDSDNFISNETSYLHVTEQLHQRVQRLVDRRWHAEFRAPAGDVAVERIDFGALAAGDVLPGRGERAGRYFGEVVHRLEQVNVRKTHPGGAADGQGLRGGLPHHLAHLRAGHDPIIAGAAERRDRVVGAVRDELGPEVAEGDDAVKDRLAGSRVRFKTEIALALELHRLEIHALDSPSRRAALGLALADCRADEDLEPIGNRAPGQSFNHSPDPEAEYCGLSNRPEARDPFQGGEAERRHQGRFASKTSTDDAAKQALAQAQSSLRNIRAVDIVSTGIRGENLDEYRAHVSPRLRGRVVCRFKPSCSAYGREAIRNMFAEGFAQAEMVCIPENIFEDGDWAILEWRDPKGLRGCGFFQTQGDRIVFQRGYWDKLSFLKLHGLEQSS